MGMFAYLGAPISKTVIAPDAMGSNEQGFGGSGVVARECSQNTVNARYQEGLEQGVCGHTIGRHLQMAKTPDPAIRTTMPFTKIPTDMLQGEWTHPLWGAGSSTTTPRSAKAEQSPVHWT